MHAKHITHSKNSTTILQYLIPGLEVECFLLKMYKNNTSEHLKDNTHYIGTMISDPIVVGDGIKQEGLLTYLKYAQRISCLVVV